MPLFCISFLILCYFFTFLCCLCWCLWRFFLLGTMVLFSVLFSLETLLWFLYWLLLLLYWLYFNILRCWHLSICVGYALIILILVLFPSPIMCMHICLASLSFCYCFSYYMFSYFPVKFVDSKLLPRVRLLVCVFSLCLLIFSTSNFVALLIRFVSSVSFFDLVI